MTAYGSGVSSRALRFALLALAFFLMPLVTAAQISTFDLGGVVKDEQGGVLPGVTLTMRNEGSGLVRVVSTNEDGEYYFAALPPAGAWELTAELSGFSGHRQTGMEFFANTKPRVNLTLKVGRMEDNLTVTGESPLVNVGQSSLGLSIGKQEIEALPLNGRDYLDLATLGSGVSDVTGAGSTVLGSKSQSVGGTYSRFTAYQLDGFDNRRAVHGVQKTDISLDAIGEFRVITNQFSAEYGDTIGGVISVITKSGTNKLQGTAFLFARPGAWDARDRLTRQKAPFNRQDAGFAMGGPIVKDRTHYFVNYEYRNEDSQAVVTAPIGGGQFRGAYPLANNRTRFLAKLDHQFNQNNLIDGKFVYGDETIYDGVGGLNVDANRRTNLNKDFTAQGTYTHLFGSSGLNELKLSHIDEDYLSSAAPSKLTPTGVVLNYPGQGILGAAIRQQGGPEVSTEFADTLTWHKANHVIKSGVDLLKLYQRGALLQSLDGVYIFSPTAQYPYNPASPASFPIQFQQGFFAEGAEQLLISRKWRMAFYVQDDWRVRSNLTLNLGLRYQRETDVPDANNIAPRLGFSWDPGGGGKTSIRGGAGIFHASIFGAAVNFERFLNPHGLLVATFAPGDPLFPQYPNALPGPTLPRGFTPPPGDFYFEPEKYAPSRRQSPESYNFTIGVERQVATNLAVSVDLAYALGRKLLAPVNLNSPAPFDYSTGLRRTPQAGDATRPFGVPGRVIRAGEISFAPDGYPFSGYRDLYLLDALGESTYWAMKFTVTKRYSDRFSLQSHYTWSRTTNDADDFRPVNSLPLNPLDREAERGRAFTDIPHAFALNGTYTLPWDISVSGIARVRSGSPVDPRAGVDLNGDRVLRERPFANGRILERNSFRVPSFAALDLGVGKRVRMGRTAVEGRLEVFNLTNRLNPDAVNNTFGPDANNPLPTFLQINSALPPRQFQISVRMTF